MACGLGKAVSSDYLHERKQSLKRNEKLLFSIRRPDDNDALIYTTLDVQETQKVLDTLFDTKQL